MQLINYRQTDRHVNCHSPLGMLAATNFRCDKSPCTVCFDPSSPLFYCILRTRNNLSLFLHIHLLKKYTVRAGPNDATALAPVLLEHAQNSAACHLCSSHPCSATVWLFINFVIYLRRLSVAETMIIK
jgi:hypothetical protein